VNDFETIFKSATVGIAMVSKKGIVLKANPALLAFLQTTENELYGKNFADITHPDDVDKDVEQFEKLVCGEISSYRMQKRYKINGHFTWGLLTVASAGEKDYVIGQVQDIDGLKAIQTELRNFAYAASHDLREPLRIINGYAYMIQSAAQILPPSLSYYLNNIVDASNRMSEMIDGLLAYSRINNDKNFNCFPIEESCKLAISNLQKTIEENFASVDIKGSAKIFGVKGQFVQLFQNLIDNAIKYRKKDCNPCIKICIKETETAYSIAVKDNGIGIPEQSLSNIFQIFKQLHPSDQYEGRGIGLALVKQIIENHNGRIWVKSDEGKGTTFYINIPRKRVA